MQWSQAVWYAGATRGGYSSAQTPGTIMRGEPSSSPGRSALLSPLPPYHPALSSHFASKAGEDPSGQGKMCQSTLGTAPLGGSWICASLSIPIVL